MKAGNYPGKEERERGDPDQGQDRRFSFADDIAVAAPDVSEESKAGDDVVVHRGQRTERLVIDDRRDGQAEEDTDIRFYAVTG